MRKPLVIAHHLIWTAYGYWLPNDPRGSGSFSIRNDILGELGDLHFGRKKAQPPGTVVRGFLETSADVLKHPRRAFDLEMRQHIADSFTQIAADEKYTCYACVVMPDHVHILIRKHKHDAEAMIENFQQRSRRFLIENELFPVSHPIWSDGGWKVFFDHPDEIRRTIRYIERNPTPIGEPLQRWPFVVEYNGWPLHPGHSPDSPYVKALKAAGRFQ